MWKGFHNIDIVASIGRIFLLILTLGVVLAALYGFIYWLGHY